jgi:hypothetical protein
LSGETRGLDPSYGWFDNTERILQAKQDADRNSLIQRTNDIDIMESSTQAFLGGAIISPTARANFHQQLNSFQ